MTGSRAGAVPVRPGVLGAGAPGAGVLDVEAISTDCYGQVKTRLREMISRLVAEGSLRLPSEAELSVALGVSRPTLRSALQSLQKEGRIRRLHGRGTFINRHALGIGANLAEAGAFVDLLAQEGHRPSVHIARQWVAPLEPAEAASLELPEAVPGLRVERVFLAGDAPAVHSLDVFPTVLLDVPVGERSAELDPTRSTFEFVETYLGRPVCYSVAEVRPVLPSPEVVEQLRIPVGQPVLRLRHVHVQANERPVAVTVAHVNDDYLRFSVIRTYLDE